MLDEQSFFDVLSDETRRRILNLLLKEQELCVCELFYALDMAQPKVSRHLAVMRESGVLAIHKVGTWVFYRVHPQLPYWAAKILEIMADGLSDIPVFRQDMVKLSGMSNRPAKCCA